MTMEKIWRYVVEDGGAGGIVIADTKNEAIKKVKNAYRTGGYGKDFNFCELIVWKAIEDDDGYLKNSPDVLECYD